MAMIAVLERFEKTLVPFPDEAVLQGGRVEMVKLSIAEKTQFCARQALSSFICLLLLPPVAFYSAGESLVHWIRPIETPVEKEVCISEDLIEELAAAYPETHGFSQSLFQDEGLGTYASPTELEGVSNWNRWLNASHIEGVSSDYRKYFVRILSNPKPFVEILKKMGVNAHRFSLEWAILEPQKGEIDPVALSLYKNFLSELQNAGIEPWGTLHHFVLPEWAEDAGGFLEGEIRDHFVDHSLKMMELFPEISHWMTFNETGGYAMQSQIRGVYPPGTSGDLPGAGRLIRNLLAAHSMIYLRAKHLYGERVQIGITHQWLKFLPLEGNFLERLICHVMSKITHYSIYNFFKTGRFEYEVPGMANICFEIPKKEFEGNNRCLDFIAPQFYGFPRIKAGCNGGHAYPGYQVKNQVFGKFGFSFGSSCHPGEKMQAFGPKVDPASLRDCLREAAALAPIAITETGCDAMIQEHGVSGDGNFTLNEEVQKSYFVEIAPILKEFKDRIKAIFIWTLIRGQLEWDRGDTPALGLMPMIVDQDRNIIGHRMTPSATLIQKIYQEKMRQISLGEQVA